MPTLSQKFAPWGEFLQATYSSKCWWRWYCQYPILFPKRKASRMRRGFRGSEDVPQGGIRKVKIEGFLGLFVRWIVGPLVCWLAQLPKNKSWTYCPWARRQVPLKCERVKEIKRLKRLSSTLSLFNPFTLKPFHSLTLGLFYFSKTNRKVSSRDSPWIRTKYSPAATGLKGKAVWPDASVSTERTCTTRP